VEIRNEYARREDLYFDLKEYVRVTDDGRAYLFLLEELMRLPPSAQRETLVAIGDMP
jgi:hypothetical protein